MSLNPLSWLRPGRRTPAALAAQYVIDAALRVAASQRVIDTQARVLQEAHERIARQGRILAAEMRDHQEARRLLSEALAAGRDATAQAARLDAELRTLERSNDNLTDIAHALRDELKAAKTAKTAKARRRGKR